MAPPKRSKKSRGPLRTVELQNTMNNALNNGGGGGFDADEALDPDIQAAIRNSMKQLNVPTARPNGALERAQIVGGCRPRQQGLSAIANSMFKPEGEKDSEEAMASKENEINLEDLSEEEQLAIALEKSKKERSKQEEELRRVLEESKKSTSSPGASRDVGDDDEDEQLKQAIAASRDPDQQVANDLEKVLKLSLDPQEQVNEQYQDHLRSLTSTGSNDNTKVKKPEAVDHPKAAPAPFIPDLSEVEEEFNRQRAAISRPARPKIKKEPPSYSKIAAKFSNPASGGYYDEEAAIQQAIALSKKDFEASVRAMSASPTTGTGMATASRSGLPGSYAAQAAAASARPSTPKYQKSKKGSFRPVIVDGCNIAFQHGKNQRFSAEGLKICYLYFKERGYEDEDIVIIVKHIPNLLPEDKETMDFLEQINVLHWCPSRYYGPSKLIRSDDDLLVLEAARSKDGIILSRDQYRDNYEKMTTYRKIIETRLVQPVFIGDTMIIPEDPLGKNGPSLDKFLRF